MNRDSSLFSEAKFKSIVWVVAEKNASQVEKLMTKIYCFLCTEQTGTTRSGCEVLMVSSL